MKTHTGEIITGARLQEARKAATQPNLDYIEAIDNGTAGFASHVTIAQIQEIRAGEVEQIRKIRAGESDHNFTVWQRMNTFLTGKTVALLPKY